jgi:hypothetical protein
MLYPEFSQYKSFLDKSNPLCNAYETKSGAIFYVEPFFYSGLMGFKEKRLDDFPKILKRIDEVVEKNRKVVFVGDFDHPFVVKDDFVYQEIQDITDPLDIFVEDKSRPSDYGD